MTQVFFDLNDKKVLYDEFHSTVMEHGLWLCRSIADRFNEMTKELLVEFSLPYDVFRLQRMYLLFYDRVVEQYKEIFAVRLYSRLERQVIRDQDELISIVKTRLFDEDAERAFAMNLTSIFSQYMNSYLAHYFNSVCDRECVSERLVAFKEYVFEEASLFIKVVLRFLGDNAAVLLSYLNDLYEKRIEIEDLFGRCIFAVVEEKYDMHFFFDGKKEERYFNRECFPSILEVLKTDVFTPDKYEAMNEALKKYVRNLLSEGMPITKYSFSVFFRNQGFRSMLAEALHFIMVSLNDEPKVVRIWDLIGAKLKENRFRGEFKVQHVGFLLDAWREYIKSYRPELLQKKA